MPRLTFFVSLIIGPIKHHPSRDLNAYGPSFWLEIMSCGSIASTQFAPLSKSTLIFFSAAVFNIGCRCDQCCNVSSVGISSGLVELHSILSWSLCTRSSSRQFLFVLLMDFHQVRVPSLCVRNVCSHASKLDACHHKVYILVFWMKACIVELRLAKK